jgi:hypothetical protein
MRRSPSRTPQVSPSRTRSILWGGETTVELRVSYVRQPPNGAICYKDILRRRLIAESDRLGRDASILRGLASASPLLRLKSVNKMFNCGSEVTHVEASMP